MKIKLLALSLLTASNVYANDLKIIKTEVNHITYEEYRSLSHPQTKNAMCTASAYNAVGKADTMITASGSITYGITNTTNSTQNYWVDEYMCINGIGCTHIRQTVVLQPNTTGNGGGTIATQQYIASRGTYIDEASIQVTGESTCFIQASNSVTVT